MPNKKPQNFYQLFQFEQIYVFDIVISSNLKKRLCQRQVSKHLVLNDPKRTAPEMGRLQLQFSGHVMRF